MQVSLVENEDHDLLVAIAVTELCQNNANSIGDQTCSQSRENTLPKVAVLYDNLLKDPTEIKKTLKDIILLIVHQLMANTEVGLQTYPTTILLLRYMHLVDITR